MKVVVVPTNREDGIKSFLKAWEKSDWDEIIVVEDGPTKSFDLGIKHHYSWKEIGEDLRENSWIISKKDSAIRCYGFLVAYRMGAEYIFSLDDDCYPEGDQLWCHAHIQRMNQTPRWVGSVLGQRTRGMPYDNLGSLSDVVFNVGLWTGVPDLDSVHSLVATDEMSSHYGPPDSDRIIPSGQYFPFCFLGDQLVTREDGTVVAISKISCGEKIVTDNDEVHPIDAIIEREVADEKVIEIKIAGRQQPLRVTGNHELLTDKGMRHAIEIAKGDFIGSPLRVAHDTDVLTNEEMFMVGLFAAEGHFMKNDGMADKVHKFCGVAISLHSEEMSTLGKCTCEFFKDRFGKNAYVWSKGNKLRIECYSKDVAYWFFQWAGEYSHKKRINWRLIRCHNIVELLNGLFAGDGHVGENRGRPHCTLKTTSWDLANQTRYLLSALGYYCSLNEYTPKNPRKKIAYQVSLYGDNATSFVGTVLGKDVVWQRKNKSRPQKWKKNDTHLFFKVEHVDQFRFTGNVYNLNVRDNHTYTVNNCVVKNCGMNFAFHRKAAPLCYFPLMGEGSPFGRFDDIWFGIIAKKVCDHLGWHISVGTPYIEHTRMSDKFANLVKEAPGIKFNEDFWEIIDKISLTAGTPVDCMCEIADQLNHHSLYIPQMGLAIQTWCDLFKGIEEDGQEVD